ncbi:hypothetical protein QS257_12990 [Terrilactibacillus sp. S3-3]|nr:hypothetical protein QS257_12990 [Terrilactibacillus sp. S3-3]
MYDDHSQIMPQENYPDALRPGYHAPNDVKSVCHQYLKLLRDRSLDRRFQN